MRLSRLFSAWFRQGQAPSPPRPAVRPPLTHVVLMDGTMSSLDPGCETNIGLTYRLLQRLPSDAPLTLHYEAGIPWRGWHKAHEVIAGIGINRRIKRAYTFLAQSYQPGDKIILLGYSRGAYAVRSLAGLIDRMGLLRPAQVTPEKIEHVYHLYRCSPESAEAKALRDTRCHPHVPVAFLGVFDTVKALGIRWPLIWRFVPEAHAFHNHDLGAATEIARHALAKDETRLAYAPVLWETHADTAPGRVVQMWFKGTHSDIGGQLKETLSARPLSNIPLVWMLGEAEAAGLALPAGWRAQFETDASAPSVGNWRGFGKLFLSRRRRRIGVDGSERLHPTAESPERAEGLDRQLDLEPHGS